MVEQLEVDKHVILSAAKDLIRQVGDPSSAIEILRCAQDDMPDLIVKVHI